MSPLLDLIAKTFAPSGIGGAFNGQTPPPLQNGFQDYGPWGAGGGAPGPGAFPAAPSAPTEDMLARAMQTAQAGPQANFQATPMQPMQQQMAAPQAPAPKEYSSIMDPERGPLRLLGQLTGAPTRAEAQATRSGAFLSKGIQEVDKRVKQGMSPQKAIMDYIQTPEGQQWLMNPGSDPVAELHNYVTATKEAAPDVRTVNDSVVEAQPGGGYKEVYRAKPTAKEVADTDAARAKITNDAAELKLKQEQWAAEKAQTGVTNAAKDRELEMEASRLNNEATKLGMELQVQKAGIAKTEKETAAIGKTPLQDDYEALKAEWPKTHPNEAFPYKDLDEYKQKYTKLQNPGGTQLSPALDKASLEWLDAADKAESQMAAFDQFSKLASKADTGWVQAATLPVKNFLYSIGAIDKAESDVPLMQVLEAESNKMALAARGSNVLSGEVGLTGNTSDKDLNFLLKSVAGIWNTPLGNQGILILAKSQARRTAFLNVAKAEYARRTGDVIGWSQEKKKLIDSTPFLTATEEAQLQSLAKQANTLTAKNAPNANVAQSVSPTGSEQDLPPATFAPDSPYREQAWQKLDPAVKQQLAGKAASTPNVRNNEQLELKGATPGVVATQPAPVQAAPAPAPTPIPGPNPMQNEAPLGGTSNGGGLLDMMRQFMTGGGTGAGPGGQTGAPAGQPGQTPATADNFITLQDILKMFAGGR